MSAGIFTSVAAFIVAIGILVTVHEFGHFWVARRLGFKVLRFSIGFGKPLVRRVSRDADQVEYVLAAIPLGGYVRLLDERDGPVPPGEEHRAFNRRPPLARIAVLLAGPIANLIFAVFAFWVLLMHGMPGLKPVIGEITPDSIAARADFRSGDEISLVAGVATPTRQAAVLGILEGVVETGRVPVEVRGTGGAVRKLTLEVPDAERRALTEPGVLLRGLGFDFWYPPLPVIVGELVPDFPAAEAGIATGDRVIEVDGVTVDDYRTFVRMVQGRAGVPTRIAVLRESRRLEFEVVPRAVEEGGQTVGRIGLGRSTDQPIAFPESMQTVERYGPLAALAPAVRETWNKSALTVHFLWKMVTGHVSTKNISGPINIAEYAGLTATAGFTYYLGFLALVSISLAVLNLLPVPVLDGGQVAYQLVEMVKGAPLSMEAQLVGQKVGIAMLVLLMGFAFYNDLSRLFG